MRVLFADDRSRTFEGLRAELARERPDWYLKFARSGQQALDELGTDRFDALLTVMDTAVIDGPELLARTRELHPDVVRLCLPGDLQDEAFLRAMPVAHQFLSAPCRADAVVEVIERTCSLRAVLHDASIRELIGKLKALPAIPQTFQALSVAIARPNAHTADITGIVSKDMALAIKTLQIVNSAFFRRSAPIMSIQAAVTYVGLEMLRSLALCASVFDALDSSPAGRLLVDLQARSLRKAHLARVLLGESRFAEEAFTAALTLDIGQAVLALIDPDKFAAMIEHAHAHRLPWHEVEPEYFGASHPAVGACLLALWGLPLELVEAVAYHHSPSRVQHTQPQVLAAVHVADAMAESAAGAASKLLSQLDARFIARPEVQRCLREWHIDESTDVRSAEQALSL